ncbi:hypothetical protein CEW92_01930 [Bacillaceae bacterium SAS-127]|nr:hypothetical protein CEW92_01930 [Bacillaceae bacterium SAS-127]
MVKKSNAAKEQILIESFEVLKENLEKHDRKMADIVAKMAAVNLDLAIEMWKFLIVNGQSIVKEDGYRFTGGVIYDLEKSRFNEGNNNYKRK